MNLGLREIFEDESSPGRLRRRITFPDHYRAPPADVGPRWNEVQIFNDVQTLEFEADHVIQEWESLDDLAASIREREGAFRQRRHASDDETRLVRLDFTARHLVDLAERLLSQGWSLGTVCPANVLITREGPPRVALLELGFYSDDIFQAVEAAPGRQQALETGRRIWAPRSPVERSRVGLGLNDERQPFADPVQADHETRILSRLFRQVLTGREAFSASGAASAAGGAETTILGQLAELETGGTLADLREIVTTTPLSSYFLGRRVPVDPTVAPPPRRHRRAAWAIGVVVLGLVAVASVGGWLAVDPIARDRLVALWTGPKAPLPPGEPSDPNKDNGTGPTGDSDGASSDTQTSGESATTDGQSETDSPDKIETTDNPVDPPAPGGAEPKEPIEPSTPEEIGSATDPKVAEPVPGSETPTERERALANRRAWLDVWQARYGEVFDASLSPVASYQTYRDMVPLHAALANVHQYPTGDEALDTREAEALREVRLFLDEKGIDADGGPAAGSVEPSDTTETDGASPGAESNTAPAELEPAD